MCTCREHISKNVIRCERCEQFGSKYSMFWKRAMHYIVDKWIMTNVCSVVVTGNTYTWYNGKWQASRSCLHGLKTIRDVLVFFADFPLTFATWSCVAILNILIEGGRRLMRILKAEIDTLSRQMVLRIRFSLTIFSSLYPVIIGARRASFRTASAHKMYSGMARIIITIFSEYCLFRNKSKNADVIINIRDCGVFFTILNKVYTILSSSLNNICLQCEWRIIYD